jgi:hypothetical protein
MAYKKSGIRNILPVTLPCKKAMYNSREEAEDMIRYLRENRGGKELSVYKCEVCGFWHLTSRSEKGFR